MKDKNGRELKHGDIVFVDGNGPLRIRGNSGTLSSQGHGSDQIRYIGADGLRDWIAQVVETNSVTGFIAEYVERLKRMLVVAEGGCVGAGNDGIPAFFTYKKWDPRLGEMVDTTGCCDCDVCMSDIMHGKPLPPKKTVRRWR